MKETHIPEVLATGKFLSAKMSRVVIEEEMGGITYSVQFTTVDKNTLLRYYEEDAPSLRKEAHQLFAGKFVSFRTEMEIVNEQYKINLGATHYLFTYGTLQDEIIQHKIFSRKLKGANDLLSGYRLSETKVAGQYPNLAKSKTGHDTISGICYLITDRELLLADAYEGHAYERLEVSLASGKKAWVYVAQEGF